jgi:hypothetical protein
LKQRHWRVWHDFCDFCCKSGLQKQGLKRYKATENKKILFARCKSGLQKQGLKRSFPYLSIVDISLVAKAVYKNKD